MNLDINTTRGQVVLQHAREAAAIFASHYPAHRYVETPQKRPAKVDGVLVVGQNLAAIVEMKCRFDMTLELLSTVRNWEWLVTKEKLDSAAQIADVLQVPLVGMLYLVPEQTLLVQRLYTIPKHGGQGEWLVKVVERQTWTQRTCNGGKALRYNAYIDMQSALVLKQSVRVDWDNGWGLP